MTFLHLTFDHSEFFFTSLTPKFTHMGFNHTQQGVRMKEVCEKWRSISIVFYLVYILCRNCTNFRLNSHTLLRVVCSGETTDEELRSGKGWLTRRSVRPSYPRLHSVWRIELSFIKTSNQCSLWTRAILHDSWTFNRKSFVAFCDKWWYISWNFESVRAKTERNCADSMILSMEINSLKSATVVSNVSKLF